MRSLVGGAALTVVLGVVLAACSPATTDPSGEPSPSTSESPAAAVDPNAPTDEQLFAAVRAGDVALAEAVLATGQGPDVWVGDTTALAVAITRDDLAMVTLLIEAGATVADDQGDHIYVAAQHAGVDVTQLLLDHGSSPVGPQGFEGEVLASAAFFGNAAVLQLLIDSGAPVNGVFPGGGAVNGVNEDGINLYPAIVAAGFGGHVATAQVLIENGADPAAVGTDGFTAAEWADNNGFADVAEYLRSVGG